MLGLDNMCRIGPDYQIQSDQNKPDFDEIRVFFFNRDTWFTPEQVMEARFRHPLDFSNKFSPRIEKDADYLFRCSICSDIGMYNQWYRMILDTIGGNLLTAERTSYIDISQGYRGNNLLKLLPCDDADYQTSSLNHVEGLGYVCDHCLESVVMEIDEYRCLYLNKHDFVDL